jgi:prepilin-type N-terminal cleavage/methylation domain-containing protein
MPARRAAFTLIELLVVIAIIALLIGLLLPALRRARDNARLAVSMSNCRQVMIAQASYRFEKKDMVPMRCSRYINGQVPANGGWDTWVYGGKDNYQPATGPGWATSQGGAFEESAYARPLNEYLYPEIKLEQPPGFLNTGAGKTWKFYGGNPSFAERDSLQMPVFRSPGDFATFQGTVGGLAFGTRNAARSSYDDVGTSYHINMKWWDQPDIVQVQNQVGFAAGYDEGTRRIRLASEFDPGGKFVWIHDQTSDVVANFGDAMGEFGDKNKSVMAYLDGRCEYNKLQPNLLYDEVGNATRHIVGKYTFIFTPPGQSLPPPQ